MAKKTKKEMVNLPSITFKCPYSKSMLKAEAQEMTKNIEGIDALKAYVTAKAAEIALKEYIECLKPEANKQAAVETSEGKFIATMGAVKINYKGTAGKWDYQNDPELIMLTAEHEGLAQQIEKRQKFLQNIEEGKEPVDQETGLIIKRALKYGGGMSLSVTIPEN